MLPLVTRLVQLEIETISATSNIVDHPLFKYMAPYITNGLQKLENIYVSKCNGLRDLFELPTARCFGDLNYIYVDGCELFEAVVAAKDRKEDPEISGTNVALLPMLTTLALVQLPFLSRIFPEGFTFRWSSIESFHVFRCCEKSVNQLGVDKKYNQAGMTTGCEVVLNKLNSITIDGRGSLKFMHKHFPGAFAYYSKDKDKLFFSCKSICGSQDFEAFALSSVEPCEVLLSLVEDCIPGGGIKIVTHNKFETRQPKNYGGFYNITDIKIHDSDSMRYLLSFSAAKYLVKLEGVFISSCEILEGIIMERPEERQEILTDINNLQDPGLRDSDNISFEASNVGSTQEISTSHSSTLINNDDKKSSYTNPLALANLTVIGHSCPFHSLTELIVLKCEKMIAIFPRNLQVRLPALKSLIIEECGMLKYVFSSSATTLTSLKRLESLRVYRCDMMKVIVKVEEDRYISEIVFPSLENMTFQNNRTLRGICLETHAFNWPSLTSLEITNCPALKIFTSGCSTTSVLNTVLFNTFPCNLCDGGRDINDIFMTAAKDVAERAFKEEGILTIDGYILAGDYLVAQYPSWSWGSDNDNNYLLPDEKHYLFGKFQHCVKRARPSPPKVAVAESINNEGDDDKNILRSSRTYFLAIIYNYVDRCPLFVIHGSDEEYEEYLPFDLLLEDIAERCPKENILFESNESASVDCSKTNSIKGFMTDLTQKEFELNIQNCLRLMLEAIFPTIQSCAP